MYPNVQLLIDGQWCDAAAGQSLPVVNPATGETIGSVARAVVFRPGAKPAPLTVTSSCARPPICFANAQQRSPRS
jgi:hypothetical protein